MTAADPKDEDAEARARALALLEATHRFPCDYALTVIAYNRSEVSAAVREAAWPGRDLDPSDGHLNRTYETHASSGGKYLSHRLSVGVRDAAEVLALYARVRSIEGVITVM